MLGLRFIILSGFSLMLLACEKPSDVSAKDIRVSSVDDQMWSFVFMPIDVEVPLKGENITIWGARYGTQRFLTEDECLAAGEKLFQSFEHRWNYNIECRRGPPISEVPIAIIDVGDLELDEPPVEGFTRPVNCGMIGLLSELEYEGKASGENCGAMNSTGLVKLNNAFMALEPVPEGYEYFCLPVYTGTEPEDREYLGWFYVTPKGYGRGHRETYDNDCIRWEWLPGVAKTYVRGNLAFMDKDLKIVHQTEYPFGENFSKDTKLAIVCSEKPQKRLGPHKEHFAFLGGKCGQINLDFEVVTPIEQPFEDFVPLPPWVTPFYRRIAQFSAVPGKGEELEQLLQETFKNLPGLKKSLYTYIDPRTPDQIHVDELWESRDAHSASLKLPIVRDAMKKGRPMIAKIKLKSEHEYDPNNDNGKY